MRRLNPAQFPGLDDRSEVEHPQPKTVINGRSVFPPGLPRVNDVRGVAVVDAKTCKNVGFLPHVAAVHISLQCFHTRNAITYPLGPPRRQIADDTSKTKMDTVGIEPTTFHMLFKGMRSELERWR